MGEKKLPDPKPLRPPQQTENSQARLRKLWLHALTDHLDRLDRRLDLQIALLNLLL